MPRPKPSNREDLSRLESSPRTLQADRRLSIFDPANEKPPTRPPTRIFPAFLHLFDHSIMEPYAYSADEMDEMA